ncbi:MAG: VOC family protein [Sphingomonas sp.]
MRVRYATLPVDDAERAIAFYTAKLRLTLVSDVAWEGHRRLELAFPSGDVGLLLEQRMQPCASHGPALVLGVPDVDAAYERLETLGVMFDTPPRESPRRAGVRFAIFRDSEDNLVRIETGA